MIRYTKKNIFNTVVKPDLCIGCGICAALCPFKCIEMQMRSGEFKPMLVDKCLDCGLCFEVCPANREELNQEDIAKLCFAKEKNIHHHFATGFYLSSYVGYSLTNYHRERGASGGMATWLLENLLISGSVDRVIAVVKSDNSDNALFKFQIMSSVEEIRNASSSKYYPVELSSCLDQIINDEQEHRYAIMGLPCFLYGIRKAISQNPKLKREIRFLIGLVCGHYPNANFTEYLSKLARVRPKGIETLDYRVKKGTRTSINYGFRVKKKDGRYSKTLWTNGVMGILWREYYFCHNACSYCDDVFAEVADIVFMDAWFPEAIPVIQGTSLIIVRNPVLSMVLSEGCQKGLCYIKPCLIESIIADKKTLIDIKQRINRLSTMRAKDAWFSKLRTQMSESVNRKELATASRKVRTMRISKALWPCFRNLPAFCMPLFFRVIRMITLDFKEQVCFGKNKLFKFMKEILPYSLVLWKKQLNLQKYNVLQQEKLSRVLKKLDVLKGAAKLNMGCGPNLQEGWINADIENYGDISIDARKTLPFPDASFCCVFAEHFIEHLTKSEAIHFLSECLRVLVPGGRVRFTLPDLSVLAAELNYPTDVTDALGEIFIEMGAITNINAASVFNCAIYGHNHKYMWTFEDLAETFCSVGFIHPVRCEFSKSDVSGLAIERRVYSVRWNFFIEAEKPKEA